MKREDEEAATAARLFREKNGLGIAPISDLVTLIEQTQSVDVAVLDVEDDDEHGLTMVDPVRGVRFVAVARSENPMRWRSNLGHELGHLVFRDHDTGEPASLQFDPVTENRAQTFTRHLLLPAGAIANFVERHGRLDLANFSNLVQRFQVSPALAAIQLREAGHIDGAIHDDWSSMYTPALAARFGWMDQYHALQAESRQRRSPQRLLARAVAGYLAGVVLIESLASVRGVPVPALKAELEEAGLQPVTAITTSDTSAVPGEADDFIDLSWMDD